MHARIFAAAVKVNVVVAGTNVPFAIVRLAIFCVDMMVTFCPVVVGAGKFTVNADIPAAGVSRSVVVPGSIVTDPPVVAVYCCTVSAPPPLLEGVVQLNALLVPPEVVSTCPAMPPLVGRVSV